jgi:ribosomal protein L29
MKAAEWREKNIGELERELSLREESLRFLRFRLAAREEKKHREYRMIRRDIARIQTILGEKDREEGLPPLSSEAASPSDFASSASL